MQVPCKIAIIQSQSYVLLQIPLDMERWIPFSAGGGQGPLRVEPCLATILSECRLHNILISWEHGRSR